MKKLDFTMRPTKAQAKKIKNLAEYPRFDVVNFDWKGQDHYRIMPKEDGGVAVILQRKDGKFVFVKQQRPFMKRAMLELVCGGREGKETQLQSARREVMEETGYRVLSMDCLADFVSAPWSSIANGSLMWARVGDRPDANATQKDLPGAKVVALDSRQLKDALRKGEMNYFSATWLMYALFLKEKLDLLK